MGLTSDYTVSGTAQQNAPNQTSGANYTIQAGDGGYAFNSMGNRASVDFVENLINTQWAAGKSLTDIQASLGADGYKLNLPGPAPVAQPTWNDYAPTAYNAPAPVAERVNTTANWNSFTPATYQGAAPTYTGLMNGDYNALQDALAVKGKIAADNAYNTGTQNLVNTMSGRGLYGSSLMQQQQTQGLDREHMNAVATNEAAAATQRYVLEQQDLFKRGEIDLATYQARMAESNANNAIGSQQNIAQNNFTGQNLDRGLLQASNINQNTLQQYLAKTTENTALQGIAANQNIAQNQNATDLYKTNTSANIAQAGLLSNEKIAGGNNATTLANTGLLGQNAIATQNAQNAGTLAVANVGATSSTAKNATDTAIQTAHDASQERIAAEQAATTRYGTAVNAQTAAAQLQQKYAAAKTANDQAMVANMGAALGYILDPTQGAWVRNAASSAWDWTSAGAKSALGWLFGGSNDGTIYTGPNSSGTIFA